MGDLEALRRQRAALNRKIAAAKRKPVAGRKRSGQVHLLRKKYPSFSNSMDRAAKQMWG